MELSRVEKEETLTQRPSGFAPTCFCCAILSRRHGRYCLVKGRSVGTVADDQVRSVGHHTTVCALSIIQIAELLLLPTLAVAPQLHLPDAAKAVTASRHC
jgi:hypothetical protein